MTTRIPKPSILDYLLRAMGKKRAVYIGPLEDNINQYAYKVAKKERFLTALLRPKDKPLPEGCIDLFEFLKLKKSK